MSSLIISSLPDALLQIHVAIIRNSLEKYWIKLLDMHEKVFVLYVIVYLYSLNVNRYMNNEQLEIKVLGDAYPVY